MKIYLSPSDQTYNPYTGQDTNEAEQCRKIAVSAKFYLKKLGHEVTVGLTGTYQERAAESNKWGADLHICIHTNAGGGDGTVVFCHPNSVDNKYVKAIYESVAALTPWSDDGIRPMSSLYEINRTTATCVYLECEFHDNATQAAWIVANTDPIGQAIAQGVANANGEEAPKDNITPAYCFYKVIVGSYNKMENAAEHVKLLQGMGISAYYWYDSVNSNYKVQVGSYKVKANAEQEVENLKKFGINDAWIYT